MRASRRLVVVVVALASFTLWLSPPRPAAADEALPPETLAAPAPAPPAAKPPGRFFVHVNLAMNVYTYLAAKGETPVTHLHPGNRLILAQQVGFGWFVHPNLRLQLTLQFAEAVTGLPAGASPFQLFGFIPWAVYVHPRFFVGAGPLVAVRYAGVNQLDVGLFTAGGLTFKLGKGFVFAVAVQVPFTFQRRFSVAITPAVLLGYRF